MPERRRGRGGRAPCPLAHQPAPPLWPTFLTQRDPLASTRRLAGAFCPLRAWPPLPTCRGSRRRPRRPRTCLRHSVHDPPFGPFFSLLALWVRHWSGAREPAARLGRDGHHRRHASTRLKGRATVWALPLEAIRPQVFDREQPRVREGLQHGRRQLRFGLAGPVLRSLAGALSGRLPVVAPALRHAEALVDPCLTLA